MKQLAVFLMLLFSAIKLHAQIGAEFETDSLTPSTFVASSFIGDNEG